MSTLSLGIVDTTAASPDITFLSTAVSMHADTMIDCKINSNYMYFIQL